MAKYRKRPVVIEAVLWTGNNFGELTDLMHDAYGVKNQKITIVTLEGTMTADVGDWIIKGVKGEFYPCKPDIFEQTYEPVIEDVGVTTSLDGEDE